MRMMLALPLLLAACGVDTDPRNDQVTVQFNEERIENAADAAAEEAGQVTSDVANSIQSTGERLENEIGDIDVDLDVRRNGDGNSN